MSKINLPHIFKQLMEDQKINQEQLAFIMQVTPSTISRLMSNKATTIDINMLSILQEKFSINIDEFIKGNLVYINSQVVNEPVEEYKHKIEQLENELQTTQEIIKSEIDKLHTDVELLKRVVVK